MQRTLIAELKQKSGQQVYIAGWAQVIREQGKIAFLILRDISGTVQVVVSSADLLKILKKISIESVIAVTGIVKAESKTLMGFELEAEKLEILSLATPELPIPVHEKNINEVDQNIRLDWRFLDLRHPDKQLIFKVWTEFERSLIEYCTEQSYIEIHSPKLLSAATEGGAEFFEVKYFDKKAFLAQSPQFYKQMAMAAGFEKVFEIGPVFRAEPSFTTRHATEYSGFDLEKSFINSHEEIMEEEALLLAHAIKNVKNKYGNQVKDTFNREIVIPTLPFPTLSLDSAKKILAEKGIESKPGDLSPEEERGISEYINETTGHEFVFITDYPATKRAFYHMRFEDRPEIAKGFDLLWNGLEVTTGAQREHRYSVLVDQAVSRGIPQNSLQFYFDFFKYGCPPLLK
jgi:aspartyl-tRNA synthetase